MTDAELLQAIKAQLHLCAGWSGDHIARDRVDALNYYLQRPRGDEIPGRSHVVSGDLSAMCEANLAQMLDAFTSDNIVEFHPFGQDDEDQAQLESDTVTYFVMSKQNGFRELAIAIKDALLLRNGVVKVWIDERRQTRTREYVNVTPEAYAQMINQPSVEVKVLKYVPDTGELKIRETLVRRTFRSEAIPIENFFYLDNHDSLEPFCAERHVDARSELVELFPAKKKRIAELRKFSAPTKLDELARNPGRFTLNRQGVDASQDLVEWYESYLLYDSDGDGISELHKVCFAENELLADVEVRLIPYGIGTAILMPHRLTGVSLFDKLKQTQDERTGLKRALLDNVNTTTKNRLAYLDGKVNVDDVSDGRPNGGIRVKSTVADIRTALMAFAVPDTSQGVLAALDQAGRERSEMGGAALDMSTAQMQIGGDRMGSQGLERAYSVAEQLAAYYTKTVAATLIRSTFLLAHATLREHWPEPVPIKRNGKWVTANPSEWPERECLTVKVGMSPGERQRRANALQNILQAQIALAEKGMDEVLVNIDGFYRVLMDWARVSDIQNPEQYFRDPQSPEAQQAIQTKRAQAQQAEEQQKALMQQAIGLEQLRTAFDKYRQDSELQFKYWAKVLDSEVAEAQIVGKATTDLLTARGKPNGSERPSEAAQSEPAAA